MGELRASLYDIFGYLLPGLIAILGIRIMCWVILYPTLVLSITPLSNSTVLTITGIIAYITGHLVHAIGNWLSITKGVYLDPTLSQSYSKLKFIRSYLGKFQVSSQKLNLVDVALERQFGPEYLQLGYEEKMNLIDEFRVLSQKDNEREIYTYREGFYRGMTIALLIFFVSLLMSLFFNKFTINDGKYSYSIQRSEIILIMIFNVITVIGFWRRMIRFSHYKTSRAVALFLILSKKTN